MPAPPAPQTDAHRVDTPGSRRGIGGSLDALYPFPSSRGSVSLTHLLQIHNKMSTAVTRTASVLEAEK